MAGEELITTLGGLRAGVAGKSKAYAAVLKDLDEALKALKDPAKNAAALGEAVRKLRKDAEGVIPPGDLNPALEKLEAVARRELDSAAFTFKRDLQAAFAEKGASLEAPSRDRLYAEPFRIDVDARRGTVNLMYGHDAMNAKPIPLDPARVVASHASAKKELADRKTNLPDLLRKIFDAYRRLVALQGKTFGDRVGVIDLYRELVWLRQSDKFRNAPSKAAFADYPRAHFAYDVRQLQATKTLTHAGHRLQFGVATIDATDDSARSVWIPDGAAGGHYLMDVYWKKEGE